MQRLGPWIKTHVLLLVAIVGVGALILTFVNKKLSTSGTAPCATQQHDELRTGPEPTAGLVVDPKAKLLLVLDHQIKDSRHDTVSVDVKALDAAGAKTAAAELPANTRVGAHLTRRPLASEPLAFNVVTNAVLSPDGRSIAVEACTVRPNRDTKPGRYVALVRVGGTGIVPENLPLEVTIRAGVTSTIIIALLAAILSLALTHYGTPVQSTPAAPDAEPAPATAAGPVALVLALLTGLLGGLAAAYVAYDSDPTWGADRGKDTINLVIATAAAASAAMSAAGAGAKAFNAFRSR